MRIARDIIILSHFLFFLVYSQPPYNGDPQGPRPFYLNELFDPAEQPRPPPQQMYYGNMFNNPEVRIHQEWNVPQPRFPKHYQQHVPSIEDHNSLPKVLNISEGKAIFTLYIYSAIDICNWLTKNSYNFASLCC